MFGGSGLCMLNVVARRSLAERIGEYNIIYRGYKLTIKGLYSLILCEEYSTSTGQARIRSKLQLTEVWDFV